MRLTKRTLGQLRGALNEDIGRGDVTATILRPSLARASARVLAREPGVFCGKAVAGALVRMTGGPLHVRFHVRDGTVLKKNQKVLTFTGNPRRILVLERTLLNFLGHLSGIATLTAAYVRRVKRLGVDILDTRKTTPLWRELEKYAVRVGGGTNHRMGLYDMILVKENHRPFTDFQRLRRRRGRFAVEVRNFQELSEAIMLQPGIILFDHFSPVRLRKAVRMVRRAAPKILLEASGGMTLHNVRRYAATGVDRISVGALTHSVPSLDFTLLVENA